MKVKRNLKEFNKLEQYLIDNNIPYEREDEERDLGYFVLDRHQLIVKNENGKISWDAICQYGSYGCENGLLEIAGNIALESDVIGWLTADDVIERIENKKEDAMENIKSKLTEKQLAFLNVHREDYLKYRMAGFKSSADKIEHEIRGYIKALRDCGVILEFESRRLISWYTM